MNKGFIILHRKMLDWEWYDDKNTKILFIHLLLTVNWKNNKWRGKTIKRGEIITSREKLAKETLLSIQQIRSALNKLKSTNEITIESSSKGTVIQIVNYEKYQVVTNEITIEQPADNQQVTTNKNVKNENNDKEIPPLEEFMSYGLEKSPEVSVDHLRSKYESWVSNDWRDGYNKPIKRWRSKLNATLPYLPKQPKAVRNLDQEYYENVMKQVNANK